jgi:tetratricopeptide (TPR) repeat protein
MKAAIVLAVALPLVHIAFLTATPTFDVPIIDSADYVDAAGAGEGIYFHSPLYSWFLALAGVHLGLVRVLQALLNGLTCAVLYALGRRVFSPRVATVAAFAWALYAPVIFFTGEILNVSWVLLLDAAALYLIVRAAEKRSLGSWLLAGGVTGLAAITRADVLPFAVLATALVWREQRSARALLFAAGVAFPLLVVGARNHIVSGHFVMLPANSGINFYIGNNPDYRQTIGIRPGLPYESLKNRPRREGVAPDPRDPGDSRYFYAQALRYITGDPEGYLGGLLYKLRILVSGIELPETFDLYTVRRVSPVLAALAFRWGGFGFPWGVVLPLALWGAWAQREHTRHARWLLAMAAAMAVPLLGYWSSSRYRMAIVPLLILWAAGGLVALYDLYRAPDRRRLGMALATVVALIALCGWPYDHFSRGHRFDAEMYGFAGLRLVRQGQPERGLALLERAVELDPGRVEFRSGLGYLLAEAGRIEEGLTHLEAAARLAPDVAPLWSNLGTALANRGDIDGAIRAFSRSLSLDSGQPYVQESLRQLQAHPR